MSVSKVVKPLLKVNLSKVICNHLVGKEHSHGHRILIGAIISIIGLWVGDVLAGSYATIHLLSLFLKGTGGLINGIGAVPIVEFLIIHGGKLRGIEQEIKIVERELAEDEEKFESSDKPCIG